MYLTLFIIFLLLSIILIALGLFKPEHSELSLAGFIFMFVLGMVVVLGGTIQYKTGVNYTYSCLCCGEYYDGERQELVFGAYECTDENQTTLVVTAITDYYENYTAEGQLGHFLGYWLAIISAVGFIGVLAGLRGNIKE